MRGEDGLAVSGEQHQVGFPMPGFTTGADVRWTLLDRDAFLQMLYGTAAPAASKTALAFPARQIMPPAIVFGAPDLSVDKPVDRFVTNDRLSLVPSEPWRHLLRRPTLRQFPLRLRF